MADAPCRSHSSATARVRTSAEVLPHDVQGAASDERAVGGLGDAELLHRLVEDDRSLPSRMRSLHERLDELLDARDVAVRAPPDR